MIRRLFLLSLLALAGCHHDLSPQDINVSGMIPALDFTMTDVRTGAQVTAADFTGKVTLLYFGYSFCTDACPRTLSSIADVVKEMNGKAAAVRVLFVTVDPKRDTLAVLKRYESLFGPGFDALRGTPDQLAALARRYRISY
ncbi:MAG: electron transporter SenC, partial [Acidocella sp. 20-61-6]